MISPSEIFTNKDLQNPSGSPMLRESTERDSEMTFVPSASICYLIRKHYGWDFRDDEFSLQAGCVYIGSKYCGKWDGSTLTLDRQAYLPKTRIEIRVDTDYVDVEI